MLHFDGRKGHVALPRGLPDGFASRVEARVRFTVRGKIRVGAGVKFRVRGKILPDGQTAQD